MPLIQALNGLLRYNTYKDKGLELSSSCSNDIRASIRSKFIDVYIEEFDTPIHTNELIHDIYEIINSSIMITKATSGNNPIIKLHIDKLNKTSQTLTKVANTFLHHMSFICVYNEPTMLIYQHSDNILRDIEDDISCKTKSYISNIIHSKNNKATKRPKKDSEYYTTECEAISYVYAIEKLSINELSKKLDLSQNIIKTRLTDYCKDNYGPLSNIVREHMSDDKILKSEKRKINNKSGGNKND